MPRPQHAEGCPVHIKCMFAKLNQSQPNTVMKAEGTDIFPRCLVHTQGEDGDRKHE